MGRPRLDQLERGLCADTTTEARQIQQAQAQEPMLANAKIDFDRAKLIEGVLRHSSQITDTFLR